MKTTSVMALRELEKSGYGRVQRSRILKAIIKHRNVSRRELQKHTGIDINAVCGRVNELMKSGFITEGPRRQCKVTGSIITPLVKI